MVESKGQNRRRFLGTMASALASSQTGMASATQARFPVERKLPSFAGATEWLNSQPLTASRLRGKVVAVDFWTYTCINWLRSLPYVRAWAGKYGDHGLVVIGVHSPEFPFEKNVDYIRQSAKERGIEYPIAVDSDHAVWRAFENEYWPALYLVDANGKIRHHQFGEGGYEESEGAIQRLLEEAGLGRSGTELVAVHPRGLEVGADWGSLGSPETYAGYERTQNFASPGGARAGKRWTYTIPERLRLNEWALAGDWTMREQAAVLSKANGRVAFRFHARDLHLVMGSEARDARARFRVLLDGRPPAVAHGDDTDDQGAGTLSGPRVYQLIRQPPPIVDRQFEIEFLEPGAEVYSFTFG